MIRDAQGAKALVADTDRTVSELLQIRLDLAGFHTCLARTGAEALESLKNIRPTVMVLELNLPDVSGYEVLEQLGRQGKLTFPTLVVGRKLAAADIQRALKLGAQDCMIKPFSGADALERVGRLLRRGGAAPARQVVYV